MKIYMTNHAYERLTGQEVPDQEEYYSCASFRQTGVNRDVNWLYAFRQDDKAVTLARIERLRSLRGLDVTYGLPRNEDGLAIEAMTLQEYAELLFRIMHCEKASGFTSALDLED